MNPLAEFLANHLYTNSMPLQCTSHHRRPVTVDGDFS